MRSFRLPIITLATNSPSGSGRATQRKTLKGISSRALLGGHHTIESHVAVILALAPGNPAV